MGYTQKIIAVVKLKQNLKIKTKKLKIRKLKGKNISQDLQIVIHFLY